MRDAGNKKGTASSRPRQGKKSDDHYRENRYDGQDDHSPSQVPATTQLP